MSVKTGTGNLSDIMAVPAAWLTAEEAAQVIGCSAQSLRTQARQDPSKLGFPVNVIGTVVRIPRDGFLFWMSYGHPKV